VVVVVVVVMVEPEKWDGGGSGERGGGFVNPTGAIGGEGGGCGDGVDSGE